MVAGMVFPFNKGECIVKNLNGLLLFSTKKQNNLFKINTTNLTNQSHKNLGHASFKLISKLKKHNLVKGLPSLVPLELLHIDLFSPTRTTSMSGKRYGLVVVDDYSK
ncbi:hypothetical protein CR513_01286, partial [Mucuna pruriens]